MLNEVNKRKQTCAVGKINKAFGQWQFCSPKRLVTISLANFDYLTSKLTL